MRQRKNACGSGDLNFYTVEDVQQILTVGLDRGLISILVERNNLGDWTSIINSYTKNITNQAISPEDLKDLYNHYNNATDITNTKALKAFEGSNRLFTSLQIYLDGVPVGDSIKENFFSGGDSKVNWILGHASETVKNSFINLQSDQFTAFKIKAIDDQAEDRNMDTELKYVFNFMKNHYQSGNRFVINIESTLYACTSCQLYLQALINVAKADGKIIEIKFLAHPEARRMENVKSLIK